MKKTSGKSNLSIIKDYVNGERPFIQVSFEGTDIADRKEGEEWEDSLGRRWTKKDGYKKRLPKKSTIVNEKRCKHCNMDVRWGNYLDDRVWPKSGLCYDCFIDHETKFRIKGVWTEFNKLRELRNEKSFLLDYKSKFEETKKWCEEHKDDAVTFLEEDGSKETWDGKMDYTKILEDVNGDLKMANDRLEIIDEEINKLLEIYENAIKNK